MFVFPYLLSVLQTSIGKNIPNAKVDINITIIKSDTYIIYLWRNWTSQIKANS